jgi:hypothetical protein
MKLARSHSPKKLEELMKNSRLYPPVASKDSSKSSIKTPASPVEPVIKPTDPYVIKAFNR